ncbi:MAG TPA: hypothetical protein VH989_06630 [Actinomycetota bacterium]|jgi:hypothetical protein
MRQWELFGITDTVPAWTPPKKEPERPAPLEPAATARRVVGTDRFPSVLWTTDAALRFTSVPGTSRIGELVGSPDIFDAFGIDGDVVEAHLQALDGGASSFELDGDALPLRCWVSPVRASDGTVCGTICVGLELDADLVLGPTVEYA